MIAPSLRPCSTRPLIAYGRSSSIGARQVAGRQRLAHRSARDALAAVRTLGITSSSKPRRAPLISEQRDVAGTAGAEAKIVADQQPPHGTAFDQHVCSMNAWVTDAEKRRLKCMTKMRSIPQRCEYAPSLSRRFDTRAGARSGAKNSRGCGSNVITAGVERALRAARGDPRQQRLVATVNAVEIADRQGAWHTIGRARSTAINLH